MHESHDSEGAPHRGTGKSAAHRILIAVALVIGLAPVYWAWENNVISFFFLYYVLPCLVPLGLVMIVDGILLGLVFKAFLRRRLEFVLLLALWFGQTAVLIAWTIGLTTSDAFLSVPEKYLVGPWNPGGLVVDSQFQETFMRLFWYAAAGILGVVVIASLVRVGVLLAGHRKRQRGTGWRVLTVVVTVFVLARMFGDTREFHRAGASLADSTSPDGKRQVRLVPVNAFVDVNGVVMFREAGSLWWYPMDRVGDQLTPSQDRVSLVWVWDSDVQVRLLVGGESWGTYDLTCGSNISRLSRWGARGATYPSTNPAPVTKPGP